MLDHPALDAPSPLTAPHAAAPGHALPPPPMALLAEVTHRCPLRCVYCSNPLALHGSSAELGTADWCHVLDQAAALGMLHVHFSGGEPLARPDIVALVAHAARLQLYTNLITSGVQLTPTLLAALVAAGLDHVQLSFQDSDAAGAETISGLPGGQQRKLQAARLVRDAGLPLTLNFVLHRQNLSRLPDMIALAEQLGASRIELAHTQYYGWGLLNRDALLPSADQLDAATAIAEAARLRLAGRMVIDYVLSDYHAERPKACMGGWAQRFMIVSPNGAALPCHAAETIPGLAFPNVRHSALADIWNGSPAFAAFRGTAWMPLPCRDCDHREEDWGGCRCQALALAGDARQADPVCHLAPGHNAIMAALATPHARQPLIYRGSRPDAAETTQR